ncbi:MAG TPA: noncanonical pyrimidine nucleotidase, YjjG family [Bacteroidetes bacterium]|nr:noncanonical pyrimidine nucleotidase, YjjG family [Bacteroidota bacterium]
MDVITLYHLNMHNFSHIRHIFFDLDNTLWDFSANSHRILYEMYQAFDLQEMGIHAFDSFHDQYRMRNSHLWSEYKLGNKTREEVRLERFQHTLYDHGIDNRLMAMRLADYYIENTRRVKDLVPGAVELLEELSAKYPLHIITNGFEEVQDFKLVNTGLRKYFRSITTAESAGQLKPGKKIFEHAMRQAGAEASESLYIGDSPDADGHGSMNAGMSFIWFNYKKEQNTHRFNCAVTELKAIGAML